MDKEFPRVNKLPPYIFNEIQELKMEARRNGEDIICDLYEVTTKEKPEDPVAFQLKHPYNVWLEGVDNPSVLIETDADPEVQKLPDPEIHFRPWAPLSTTKTIMIKIYIKK